MIKRKVVAFLLGVFLAGCGGGSTSPAPPKELPSAFSQSVQIVPTSGGFFYVVTFLENNNASVSQFLIDESGLSSFTQKISFGGKAATLIETVTVTYAQSEGVINVETSFSNGIDFSAAFSLDDDAAITAVDLEINGEPVEASFEVTLTSDIVTSTNPESDATDISRGTAVEINFAAAMDCNTLTENSVTLSLDDESVAGTVNCSEDGLQVTFTPEDDLALNEEHCLTLSTAVQDRRGNALAQEYESCFTTICASSAFFDRPAELGCFTLYKLVKNQGITQEAFPGSLLDSASIGGGTLTLDFKAINVGAPALVKQVASGDFEVELHWSGGMPANPTEKILFLVSTLDVSDFFGLQYRMDSDGNRKVFSDSFVNDAESPRTSVSLDTSCITLRVARSGNSYTASYKPCDGTFTTLVTETRNAAGDSLATTADPLYIFIVGETENALGTFAPQLDHFRFLSGSAEGQE